MEHSLPTTTELEILLCSSRCSPPLMMESSTSLILSTKTTRELLCHGTSNNRCYETLTQVHMEVISQGSASTLLLWPTGGGRECSMTPGDLQEPARNAGGGRASRPPLYPIPMSKPFQILGIDVMDLPLTDQGNKHVVVIQDLFTKWPLAFAVLDKKTTRIARLVAEEVIPLFGVPECLLSDRGTNLLSNLMMELCKILGIKKLNTTTYHPQCDGAVERFNRKLKTILRKHAAKFGCQWDRFLPGILWAYRNTPHT